MKNEIRVENNKTFLVISNLKCVEDEWADCPRLHVSFDVNFQSSQYNLKLNFSEMLVTQFDFKQRINEIIDENFQEKKLIISKNEICLQIQKTDDDLNTNIQLALKLDPDKIDDFKIELNAYVDCILKNI